MDNKQINKKAYCKEEASRLLEEVIGWVKHADNKASILGAFIVLLAGFNIQAFEAFKIMQAGENIVLCVFLGLFMAGYLISFALSMGFESLVLISRSKSPIKYKIDKELSKASPLYYGAIQKMTKVGFNKKTADFTEESYLEELNEQIMIVSYVASLKFQYFNRALISSLSMFGFSVTLLILINIA